MASYREQFASLNGSRSPFPYQEAVGEQMFARKHVILRAPTGAGKTLAALVPYLIAREEIGVRGMIYVLPLRTLVEAVFAEASMLAKQKGLSVAVQTGERADAEFFHDADIIITTFDQLLSGLLCDPYGLSHKLWNINAAAIAGKLVVFDEFHLMESHRAFASAVFGVKLFRDLCVSLWMTATATSALTKILRDELDASEVELTTAERDALFAGRGIVRRLRTHWGTSLTADELVRHSGQKVLVVVNTVGRAQALFQVLPEGYPALVLHSRFFSDDRLAKQRLLKSAPLVIATQVIEAGVDISNEIVLTEVAPVNALVQRAGRCARFANESGTVHVYDAPTALPYETAELETAKRHVIDTDQLDPATCERWVERAHMEDDRRALTGFGELMQKRRTLVLGCVTGEGDCRAAAYIRRSDDTVRAFIFDAPKGQKPQAYQAIQVRRNSLRRFQSEIYMYDGEEWVRGEGLATAYAVALPMRIAEYTVECGLRLGVPGSIESYRKEVRERPGYSSKFQVEPWVDHTRNVVDCSLERMRKEGLGEDFARLVGWTAKLHDVGKLQHGWQRWAWERQAIRGSPVNVALAHTDYDAQLHRGEPRPPRHAAASALYAAGYIGDLSERERTAVLLAVLAHHGGTIRGMEAAEKLHSSAREALQELGMAWPQACRCARLGGDLGAVLAESFEQVWPLAAILSRVLRLSDQKATAEGGNE